jgi:hypothetical protein
MADTGVALALYDAACASLAAARSVDEVKEIRDQSIAMMAYARQAKNRALEADAFEIRVRAERRLGEMIVAQREIVGMATGGTRTDLGFSKNPRSSPPTLADVGIDKNLAHRAPSDGSVR